MKKIDKVRAGDLIAHWRLAPTAEDIAAVKGIVKDAVRRCGLKAAVRVATCKMECPSLGHGNILVKLSIRNPKPTFRTAANTLVKGLTTIMVKFEKCAGLFDFNAHGKRNDEGGGTSCFPSSQRGIHRHRQPQVGCHFRSLQRKD